jgi:hypothetical protein
MTIEKTIKISGPDLADSQLLTADLMSSIKLMTPDISVERGKGGAETMDLGTILTVVLGSAAVTAVAKGIADWLRRQPKAKITIYSNGKLEAENISSADAVKLTEIFKS